jgi:hypothetical protein
MMGRRPVCLSKVHNQFALLTLLQSVDSLHKGMGTRVKQNFLCLP